MADAVTTTIGGAGGGGGGDIVDTLGTGASLDGIFGFEKQTSAPGATADYGKVYSKTITETDYAADFNGSSSYLTIPDIAIGTGPYSIEFFVKFDAFSASANVILTSHSGQSSGGAGYFAVRFTASTMVVQGWDGSYKTNSETISASTGVWYHAAICRDGSGNLRQFFSAADAGTATLVSTDAGWTDTVGDATYDWTIGRLREPGSSSGWYHDGQVNDLLITKTAKYTEAYTIPTTRFNNEVAGEAGYHFDGNLNDFLGEANVTGGDSVGYVAGNFSDLTVSEIYAKNSHGDAVRLSRSDDHRPL